jgi:hypothetical protein
MWDGIFRETEAEDAGENRDGAMTTDRPSSLRANSLMDQENKF